MAPSTPGRSNPGLAAGGCCLAATLLAGCEQLRDLAGGEQATAEAPAALYQAVPVQRRSIRIAVDAAGAIEPVTTVEVKSKASGEILSLPVDTGDDVAAGTLLARIDRRVLNNSLQLAEANLEVAKAQLANAESALERGSSLYERQSLSKADWERTNLEHATAKSAVVQREIQLENAAIALEDADVLSPIAGTVIERLAEQGQVISSPMGDVGGGTLLMKMADLSHVQVRMLVDEIDIGKVRPGELATVNVAAYPSRSFQGTVIKVEPQAEAVQNVTMFPVLIDIENQDRLLKPGMNAEVELLIAQRDDVPAIPNAALRTPEDVYAAGSVLGLAVAEVRAMLEAAPAPPPRDGEWQSPRQAGSGPPAGSRERMRAVFAKLRRGETLTAEERQLADAARRRMAARAGGRGPAGGRRGGSEAASPDANAPPRRRGSGAASQTGGDHLVFALRDGAPTALRVRTGITDLDYAEVVFGLAEGDQVLILPSASLVRAQESFQRRISGRMGIPGLSRSGR